MILRAREAEEGSEGRGRAHAFQIDDIFTSEVKEKASGGGGIERSSEEAELWESVGLLEPSLAEMSRGELRGLGEGGRAGSSFLGGGSAVRVLGWRAS